MAKAEADREMKLTQQLAVEKQRAAILQKENEIQKLKFEIAQKTFEKEIRRKVSEETQQVPNFSNLRSLLQIFLTQLCSLILCNQPRL